MENVHGIYSFEDDPPEQESRSEWDIVRAPKRGEFKMVVISARPLGMRTHFHNGRTMPHLLKDCPGCKHGLLSRWHGWFLGIGLDTHRQIIFEYTAAAHGIVRETLDEAGTIRGFQVAASRKKQVANGPVVLRFAGMAPSAHLLPPDQPIFPIIARIFGLRPDVLGGENGELERNMTQHELQEASETGNGKRLRRL